MTTNIKSNGNEFVKKYGREKLINFKVLVLCIDGDYDDENIQELAKYVGKKGIVIKVSDGNVPFTVKFNDGSFESFCPQELYFYQKNDKILKLKEKFLKKVIKSVV